MVAVELGGRQRERERALTLPLQPALVMLLAAAWAFTHPYSGLVHDSRLYVLQAFAEMYPGLGQDLFLAYGSQSHFTIFPHVHAAVVGTLGLETANMALLAMGHGLLLGAILLLSRRLAKGAKLWIVASAIVLMPGVYGGFSVLTYGETFLTPRVFVEAATLAALAAMLGGRWRSAIALQAVAFFFHPLMALPGLGVILIYLAFGNWRWVLAAAIIVLAVIAAAAAGLPLAGRLFQTMEPDWFEWVSSRNGMVLPLEWDLADWYALGTSLTLAAAGAIAVRGRRRKLMVAIILAAMGGTGLTVIAGDWLANALIVQLQLWRSLWLLEVAAAVGLVLAIYRLRRHRANGWAIAAMLVVALLGPPLGLFGPSICAVALITLVFVYAQLTQCLPRLSRLTLCICFGFAGVLILSHVVAEAYISYRVVEVLAPVGLLTPSGLFKSDIARLALLFAVVGMVRVVFRTRRPVAYLLTGATLVGAVVIWDQRADWQTMLESVESRPAFADSLPVGAQVYWPDAPIATWTLLQRSNYVSYLQGSGLLFYRETTNEYVRRIEQLGALSGRLYRRFGEGMEPCDEVDHVPSGSDVVMACHAASDLDYLVLPWRISGIAPTGSWHAPVDHVKLCVRGGEPSSVMHRHFHLYDCEALLDEARDAAARSGL